MSSIENSLKSIELGLSPGHMLVWNSGASEGRRFEVHKRRAFSKGEGYETTLEKVADRVQTFFETNPNLPDTKVLESLKKRVAPYRGWYGWWLWLTFRGSRCTQVINRFEEAIEKVISARPLPSVPPAGIQVGIRNRGNTCWMNAVIKFLASTDLLDDAINQGQTKLHRVIKRVFHELRTGARGSHLSSGALEGLINSVAALTIRRGGRDEPLFAPGSKQEDASEFLQCLVQKLWDNAFAAMNTLREVREKGVSSFFFGAKKSFKHLDAFDQEQTPGKDYTKPCSNVEYKGEVKISLEVEDFTSDEPLNLNEILTRTGTVEVAAEPPDGSNHPYLEQLVVTHLPDHLFIYVARSLQMHRETKCMRKIQVDEKNTIAFALHDAETLKKIEDVHYRIDAAIRHWGGASGGHYTAEVRNADGTLSHHNDSSVSTFKKGTRIGEQGLYLKLTKIKP